MPVQTIWRNISFESFVAQATALLWTLLILSLATGLRFEVAKMIGKLALSSASVLAPALALIALKNARSRELLKRFLSGCGVLAALYLIPRENFDNYQVGLRRAFQIIVLASVYTTFFGSAISSIKWPSILRWVRISLLPPALYLGYVLLTEPFSLRGWPAGFVNPNVAGMALFALWPSLMLICKKSHWWQVGAISSLLLFFVSATSSRASTIGLLITGILFWITGRRIFTRIHLGIFISILALSFAIIAVATLGSWSGGSDLDMWLVSIFEKSLFSGRNELWGQALTEIKDTLLFGLGGGAQMKANSGSALSIHNLFLQTFYQVGIAGLSALVWILYSAWPKPNLHPPTLVSRLATAYMSGILIVQVFEVTLTQNNLTLGLPFWAIMGFAAGMTEHIGHTADEALRS